MFRGPSEKLSLDKIGAVPEKDALQNNMLISPNNPYESHLGTIDHMFSPPHFSTVVTH